MTSTKGKSNSKKHTGHLKSTSTFTVHTRTAQKIVLGSNYDLVNGEFIQNETKGYSPPGFFRFAGRITQLFKALGHDDPFAELYLAKIYQTMMAARKKLITAKQTLQKASQSIPGLKLNPYQSPHPQTYPIHSRNPYTGLAIIVMLEYDQLAALAYALEDLMLGDRKQIKADLYAIKETIHQAFTLAFYWKHTDVTRYDVRHNTQKAQKAYQMMKVKLSKEIVSGDFHAPFIPLSHIPPPKEP